VTNWTMAVLTAPSFHEGKGSADCALVALANSPMPRMEAVNKRQQCDAIMFSLPGCSNATMEIESGDEIRSRLANRP
jgi:hypothetical protein